MTATETKSTSPARREWIAVLALTILGGLLRLGSVGRSGLTHFDEGIYALAGGWVFQASGLDPGLIPYAPPLYVLLVGAAYLFLGASDVAAILVSTVAGTLTIPVVGWLGRRHFGPGAGAAAALLAAFALPHQVFSRMALTDAVFLLAWLIALGAGSAFVERPGWLRGVALGLAVGAAQLAKYNGWLAGGIVLAAVVWELVVDPASRSRRRLLRVFGFGLVGAIVAAVLYAPWFLFVERHGGYRGLLAHQRSYLGGVSAWPGHLVAQFRQEASLSGPLAFAPIVALAMLRIPSILRSKPRGEPATLRVDLFVLPALVVGGCVNPLLGWTIAAISAPIVLATGSARLRFLAWCWLIPAALTPFYHPYARLWLPLSAVGWLVVGGAAASVGRNGFGGVSPPVGRVFAGLIVGVSVLIRLAILSGTTERYGAMSRPTDELRTATRSLASALPEGGRTVQVLARPPLMFYLAGRVGTRRLPDSAALTRDEWAIVDEVQIRQELDGERKLRAILDSWRVVRVEEAAPGPATLFDVDPAYAGKAGPPPKFKLWLIRP